MKRDKSITVPLILFNQMASYILMDEEPYNKDLHRQCIKGIEEKVDRMTRHDLYTKYKTEQTEEAREKARQEYLESAGIPKSFRW